MIFCYWSFGAIIAIQIKNVYDTVFPPNLSQQQLDYLAVVGRRFYIQHGIALGATSFLIIFTICTLRITYKGARYVNEVLLGKNEGPKSGLMQCCGISCVYD